MGFSEYTKYKHNKKSITYIESPVQLLPQCFEVMLAFKLNEVDLEIALDYFELHSLVDGRDAGIKRDEEFSAATFHCE